MTDMPQAVHWTGGTSAGNIVNKMVRDGTIPSPSQMQCVDCGKQAAHYDHRDYSKPLQVDPVCRSCNAKRGPAMPIPGSIANLVNRGLAPYRNKAPVARLLRAMGKSDAMLSKLPGRLTNEHWRELVSEFMEDTEAA